MDKKEERLIKIVTQKLEEYGMPKFKDNYPALDIIKTIQDFALFSEPHPQTKGKLNG